MTDPAYDGQVFNIALCNVPETKSDLVADESALAAPNAQSWICLAKVLVTKKM